MKKEEVKKILLEFLGKGYEQPEFDGLRWTNPGQAVFLFQQPTDEILASWLKDEGKFIKKYEEARNFLRDKVEGKR